MHRILLVEDEPAIAQGLCDCLTFHEFEVEWRDRGDTGLSTALSEQFDLVLLDVMLPEVDGFTICQQLRAAQAEQAIIMLTAKGSEADILEGFQNGADDYVCKPFSLAQLVARIQALLRRRAQPVEQVEQVEDIVQENFSIGTLQVDLSQLLLLCGEQSVSINRRDAEILHMLAEDTGRIVSRRRLLHDVWGFSRPDDIETRRVDMHIAKLRKKLDMLKCPGGVETVRGEGYRWAS